MLSNNLEFILQGCCTRHLIVRNEPTQASIEKEFLFNIRKMETSWAFEDRVQNWKAVRHGDYSVFHWVSGFLAFTVLLCLAYSFSFLCNLSCYNLNIRGHMVGNGHSSSCPHDFPVGVPTLTPALYVLVQSLGEGSALETSTHVFPGHLWP